ncbi:hypothetical protein [Rhizosaccharibacter radicis]|uniref:SH3 domain-containing protein n=1 Tax=Rhizosaccharibacter radicis TaxID=2782605 RepID=A0ABT1W1L5_9PROT|nr:hypothetical protein [Acetobacteraceae bacterium KSS12]
MNASCSPPRRSSRTLPALASVLCAALSVAGCKQRHAGPKAGGATHEAASGAVSAAERDLRAAFPGTGGAFAVRGVSSFGQAMDGRTAVCGQVNPFPGSPSLFVPFVSVLTEDVHAAGGFTVDRYVGTDTDGASRVYLAMIRFCYENGGPGQGPVHSVMALPPGPNAVGSSLPGGGTAPPGGRALAANGAAAAPVSVLGAAPPAASASVPNASGAAAPSPAGVSASADSAAGAVSGQTAASGVVVTRQNANIHAAPHGASVRVVPANTSLRVFARAGGGWLEVGDTAPWGWVHESMVRQ